MCLHSTRTNYPNSKPSSLSSYSLILTVCLAENQPIFKALFELTRDRIHCLPHANLAALMMLCTVIRKYSSFMRTKLYMCFYYTPHNTKFNNKLPHNQQNITSFSKYKIDYGYQYAQDGAWLQTFDVVRLPILSVSAEWFHTRSTVLKDKSHISR